MNKCEKYLDYRGKGYSAKDALSQVNRDAAWELRKLLCPYKAVMEDVPTYEGTTRDENVCGLTFIVELSYSQESYEHDWLGEIDRKKDRPQHREGVFELARDWSKYLCFTPQTSEDENYRYYVKSKYGKAEARRRAISHRQSDVELAGKIANGDLCEVILSLRVENENGDVLFDESISTDNGNDEHIRYTFWELMFQFIGDHHGNSD